MIDTPASDSIPAPAAKRHQLAILFADLSDSTQLASQMEAEDYGQLLADLRQVYREVIPRHGGVIVRIQGDGVLAIFGHPDPREDDGWHAVEAALDLHLRVRAMRVPAPGAEPIALCMHSGVHAGQVLLDHGDEVRGRFELFGQAPAVAARLSDLAERDQVLASEAALGAQAPRYETGRRLLLALDGHAAPVPAYQVLGRRH